MLNNSNSLEAVFEMMISWQVRRQKLVLSFSLGLSKEQSHNTKKNYDLRGYPRKIYYKVYAYKAYQRKGL